MPRRTPPLQLDLDATSAVESKLNCFLGKFCRPLPRDNVRHALRLSSKVLASLKSSVSKPSVNQL